MSEEININKAKSIIISWATALKDARTDSEIEAFIEKHYYKHSFFKPTLDAFVQGNKSVLNYFKNFRPGLEDLDSLEVIQASTISSPDEKLVAKGTYSFRFTDSANPKLKVIVRADFSFIFDNIRKEKKEKEKKETYFGKIYLQHSSLQVKERIKRG
jgi:hypothetical protein